jgi:hypothetical protein
VVSARGGGVKDLRGGGKAPLWHCAFLEKQAALEGRTPSAFSLPLSFLLAFLPSVTELRLLLNRPVSRMRRAFTAAPCCRRVREKTSAFIGSVWWISDGALGAMGSTIIVPMFVHAIAPRCWCGQKRAALIAVFWGRETDGGRDVLWTGCLRAACRKTAALSVISLSGDGTLACNVLHVLPAAPLCHLRRRRACACAVCAGTIMDIKFYR